MSAVKALQQWCRVRCDGYRDVSITNMTTSFRDGMAFCALIHKHRPDLIDFDSLKKENVYDNNKLAFQVAEEQLGIPALLDAEDMVALRVPDRLSILTYVSQYYNCFHGRSPIGGMAGVKRPAEVSTNEPSGKKNQPVSSQVFPSSKPARENSPPRSSNITKPPPSPRRTRNNLQDVPVEKSPQTGTLSNKCVSCHKHVHLVQRHLVDGKLYHRNCAKLLPPANTSAPLRDLPQTTAPSKVTSQPAFYKTHTPAPAPSRLGPTWMAEKPSPPSSYSSTVLSLSPSRPAASLSSPAKESHTAVISKPAAPQTSNTTVTTTSSVNSRPTAAPRSSTTAAPTFSTTFTTTTSVNPRPTAAPRAATTEAKSLQSRLKFFHGDTTANEEEKKNPIKKVDLNKRLDVNGKIQEATVGQPVVVSVSGVGRKQVNITLDPGDRAKAAGVSGKKQEDGEISKTKAAAFISKKLSEENSHSNKPTTGALKKTDKPSHVETPKKETGGVRGRVKLRADPSILADLQLPPRPVTPNSGLTPAGRIAPRARTPDRVSASPNTSASDSESPADWRSRLKPVTKVTKPDGSSQFPPADGAGRSQTSDLSVRPVPSSHPTRPVISVTPPASKNFLNGQRDTSANDVKSESNISKTKPDFIPKDDIIKELRDIEVNLNELENRGVELETKLRRSEEDGEDDALMDELMVEWFNLIRNKQVAMRRESELVYIGKTQDLEEQQPSVEQELRRLMEKPEHLKTARDRKREEELMTKLVTIVNDRNAIVEGLDEDRLREGEEDEQLNQLMMNFNIKKDKPKKKSPMSKLFSWGNKKEA